MRHILCNYARDRSARKRGGGLEQVTLDEGKAAAAARGFTTEKSDALVALEKGTDPPPWPVDPPREAIRVDGILLLSGLIWPALGIGGMIAAFAIVTYLEIPDRPPATIALLGIPASLVGVAHLIVYRTYRKGKE